VLELLKELSYVYLIRNIGYQYMNNIRIHEWSKLNFVDPAMVLRKLRKVQLDPETNNLNERVKNLRTHTLKKFHEGWEAVLFCYGQSIILGVTVYIALYESSDYDAVAMWIKDETQYFSPLQIKEVVPPRLNSTTDINKEIEKLKRYPVSKDTTVVLHLNRSGRLELKSIHVPKLNLASLWLMGATEPDQSIWFLAGDMLTKPSIIEFHHPGE
jgi:hypothetical protein